MTNSLDLDPEWGAIDLLKEVEATFGIKIADEEAERCATVGDLYGLVCAHSPDWDAQKGSCCSSMIFYRIRRSISPDNKRGVKPDMTLVASGLQPSRLFKKIADETGLRVPASELTWLGTTGSFLLAFGIMAAIVALLNGHWLVASVVALIALAGLPLLIFDAGRFPAGIVTIADLVRRTAALNATALKDAGGQPANRWAILAALAAEHGRLPPDKIRPETFFHRRSLKEAIKQA